MIRSSLAFTLALALAAPVGAASFTYRGHLEDGGQPAEGSYRLELRLYADREGRQPLAAPVVVDEVTIKGGRFAVGVDFPDVPADAHSGWLEVAVMSPEDGAFWPLPEKQAVALKAQICPESWALAGNADTNPLSNFLGTTDSQPLIVRVAGRRALRIEPHDAFTPPSIIGGHASNSVGDAGSGSFIGGGGTASFPNHADGGRSVIAGGSGNATRQFASVVPGGFRNCAGGEKSFAAGFRAKVRASTNPGGDDACADLGSVGGVNGDQGTFVWADSTNADFVSSGNDQFLIRAGGGMGVGTNAPQTQLHIRTTVDAPGVEFGFNPALLVENDNPADFFTQALFARVSGSLGRGLVVEASHSTGSTLGIQTSVVSASGRAIQASSPAGGYAAFFEGGRVFSQGNVGIGVANPSFQLHLSQDSAAKPTSNTWTVSSDERLKTDIETLESSLQKLLALRGVSFRWRDPDTMGGHDGTYAGLIAQNVEQVFPEWVGTDPQGYKTVTVTGFEGLVAEALRELRAEKDAALAELAQENAELRAEIAGMREDIAMVRALLSPSVAEGGR
jgi:hypothetical protein